MASECTYWKGHLATIIAREKRIHFRSCFRKTTKRFCKSYNWGPLDFLVSLKKKWFETKYLLMYPLCFLYNVHLIHLHYIVPVSFPTETCPRAKQLILWCTQYLLTKVQMVNVVSCYNMKLHNVTVFIYKCTS